MNAANATKQFIIDSFIQDASREKQFVLCDPLEHDEECIKRHNTQSKVPVLTIGENIEWLKNKKIRESLVSELVEEGFNAEFMQGPEFSKKLQNLGKDSEFEVDASDNVDCNKCGISGHYARSCPSGDWQYHAKYGDTANHKCWVLVAKGTYEQLSVLKVVVPDA